MNYYQHSTSRIQLGGESLLLYSKPGMVAWDDVAAASALLAEEVSISAGMRVLVLESAALSIFCARQSGDTHFYTDNLITQRMAQQMAGANKVSFTVHDNADEPLFDLAVMINPKGRAYARLLLQNAHRALKPDGRLIFCGANAQGAKAIATDAGEVFGTNVVTLRTKAHQRLCSVQKSVLVGAQRAAPLPSPTTITHNGLTLYTLPGVFSREELDAGTAMLLSTLDEPTCAGKRVLDVGCGYGVIGMQAAKLGAAHVEMIDVSMLALYCTQSGVDANGLGEVCHVFGSDLYSDVVEGAQYDLIVSNPPFHTGHSVDTAASEALISGARERLTKGGALRIVANRFLPYDKLLRKVFDKVEVVKEDGKFWVLEGRV